MVEWNSVLRMRRERVFPNGAMRSGIYNTKNSSVTHNFLDPESTISSSAIELAGYEHYGTMGRTLASRAVVVLVERGQSREPTIANMGASLANGRRGCACGFVVDHRRDKTLVV